MPKYIYIHPDTNEEIEIVHAMSEVRNPSAELLKKIALPDGRIMQRKIVAPALLGFDNLGRSILKKDAAADGGAKEVKSEKKPAASTATAG